MRLVPRSTVDSPNTTSARQTITAQFGNGTMGISINGETIPKGMCVIDGEVVPSGTKITPGSSSTAFTTHEGRVYASIEDLQQAMAGTFTFPEETST